MLCKKPYMQGVLPFGCGQCTPCRINKRRLWANRILLESMCHDKSSFVTLTYSPDKIPKNNSLEPKHYKDFFKRLRYHLNGEKIRYFICGEYGDKSERPHYHAAIFGLGILDSKIIESCWKHGFTYTGDLTADSASYIAGYVTKKMTKKDDPRLKGRYPEFGRMSLKPGIGALAVPKIIDVLTSHYGSDEVMCNKDVPMYLKTGRKKMPLGRYLREKMRLAYGFSEKTTPLESLATFADSMRELFKKTLADPANHNKSLEEILVQENKQKILNIENKTKIYASKGKKI